MKVAAMLLVSVATAASKFDQWWESKKKMETALKEEKFDPEVFAAKIPEEFEDMENFVPIFMIVYFMLICCILCCFAGFTSFAGVKMLKIYRRN